MSLELYVEHRASQVEVRAENQPRTPEMCQLLPPKHKEGPSPALYQ